MEQSEQGVTPEQAPEPGAVVEEATQAAQDLRDLFATLVPPDTIELTDALGNRYTVRSALPARAQIRVMQQMDELLSAEVDTSSISLVAQGGGLNAMANALVSLSKQPKILDGLAATFTAAHPAIVKQAGQAATEAGVEAADAADLFPAEELVAGLVPFIVRSAGRLVELATGLGAASPAQ